MFGLDVDMIIMLKKTSGNDEYTTEFIVQGKRLKGGKPCTVKLKITIRETTGTFFGGRPTILRDRVVTFDTNHTTPYMILPKHYQFSLNNAYKNISHLSAFLKNTHRLYNNSIDSKIQQ